MPGLTLVGYGWSLLSFIAAAMVSFGYFWPKWIIGSMTLNGQHMIAFFGCFRRCNYPWANPNNGQLELVELCGRYRHFADIPSFWWKICTVTVGIGAGLALLVAFITIPAYCFSDIISRTSARLMGLFQIVAAVIVVVGCMLYPLGWDNREMKEACGGHSGPYLLGTCTIGWSYIMVLGGALLLLICASLSTSAGHSISWTKLRNANNVAASLDEHTVKTANV